MCAPAQIGRRLDSNHRYICAVENQLRESFFLLQSLWSSWLDRIIDRFFIVGKEIGFRESKPDFNFIDRKISCLYMASDLVNGQHTTIFFNCHYHQILISLRIIVYVSTRFEGTKSQSSIDLLVFGMEMNVENETS